MKKASKVLVLLLLAVFVVGAFSGCGVFGRNSTKYRETTAMTIGEEKITVGKLIDTFNNNYNNYYQYISQGYISVKDVFEMSINSLYSQYIKLDAYKTASGVQKYTHSKTSFVNQEYLTDDELEYAVTYVKYALFSAMDGLVEDYIAVDYELGSAASEDKDTSRDFAEPDKLDADTYSAHTFAQSFKNEDMDEYISKYYDGIIKGDDLSIDGYVYTTEAAAKAKIDAINERIEGEEKITFSQYKDWQEQAVAQYAKNVQKSYKYGIDKLITRQVEDYIVSIIVTKYNYSVYGKIDTTDLAATVATLTRTYEDLRDSQIAGFNINKDFVNYIESLSSSSYIYAVPEGYNYVFVKNILVPFTTEQTTVLSNLQKQLGSSSDARYLAKRTEFASKIIADNFLSEKDDDGNYQKVENLFKLDSQGNLIINPDGDLGPYFKADGSVVAMEGKTLDETVKHFMSKYNTDVGQHSAQYEYVVRVGKVPDNYTAKWVTEFVDATNDAILAASGMAGSIGEGLTYETRQDAVNAITGATLNSLNGGYYGIAISTYGVHIVYYSANVVAQTFDFSANWLNTSTPEYRMFKTYYEKQSSELLSSDLDALKKVYFDGKISKTAQFDKFLKENKIEFDFEKSLEIAD